MALTNHGVLGDSTRWLGSLLAVILIGAVTGPASAQLWMNTYGDPSPSFVPEDAQEVIRTHDGGLAVVGRTTSGGTSTDLLVLKLDDQGAVQWQRSYGGSAADEGFAIEQTGDGGYIVAGHNQSHDSGPGYAIFHFWALKLNHDGDVEWERVYGVEGQYLEGWEPVIRVRAGGGYLLAGETYTAATKIDGWVLALHDDGAIDWQYRYTTPGKDDERINDMRPTPDGGCVVVGTTDVDGATDAWVVRIGGGGHLLWERALGGSKDDAAFAVRVIEDAQIFVAGYTRSFARRGPGPYTDMWVVRMEGDGEVVWQKAYGGGLTDEARGLDVTDDGRIAVTGVSDSFDVAGSDIWTLLLEPDGAIAWQRLAQGDPDREPNEGRSVVSLGGDELAVAGSVEFDDDVFVMRLNHEQFEDGCTPETESEALDTHAEPYVPGSTEFETHALDVETGFVTRAPRLRATDWCP